MGQSIFFPGMEEKNPLERSEKSGNGEAGAQVCCDAPFPYAAIDRTRLLSAMQTAMDVEPHVFVEISGGGLHISAETDDGGIRASSAFASHSLGTCILPETPSRYRLNPKTVLDYFMNVPPGMIHITPMGTNVHFSSGDASVTYTDAITKDKAPSIRSWAFVMLHVNARTLLKAVNDACAASGSDDQNVHFTTHDGALFVIDENCTAIVKTDVRLNDAYPFSIGAHQIKKALAAAGKTKIWMTWDMDPWITLEWDNARYMMRRTYDERPGLFFCYSSHPEWCFDVLKQNRDGWIAAMSTAASRKGNVDVVFDNDGLRYRCDNGLVGLRTGVEQTACAFETYKILPGKISLSVDGRETVRRLGLLDDGPITVKINDNVGAIASDGVLCCRLPWELKKIPGSHTHGV